jgi:glycerol-3-phosphate acyltransferase PlsY
MDIAVKLILIPLIGYLLGAIPSALMIGKLVGKIDIHKSG